MDGGAIAEVIYEMAQAIGKPFSVGTYLVSPFSCPPAGQDVLDAFVDRGVPVWIGTMPIAGMTAPIFMLGAHMQALAELMAGITLAHILTQGRAPIFWTPIDSVRAHPFDMRDAVFVYGSAEDQIGTMMQAQINRRVSLPFVAKSLLTTARDPDAQAAAEKASHTLLAALLGASVVTNAGLLSVDDYISPIQMVIDHEIVEYAARVRQGSPVDDEAMGVETIREVVSGASSFIEHETTYVNFRTVAWYPEVFRHLGFKGAAQKGIPSLAEQARQRAVELINQADAVLPESQRAVLEAIYRDAEHRLKDHVTPS
jgi:trimethylamine:corrinoid methyltransferase-like protein